MESEQAAGRSGIIACSALKETYRDTLGRGEPWIRFVHLNGSRDLIKGRMRAREGHFMPVSLLDSQFATLESPPTPSLWISLSLQRHWWKKFCAGLPEPFA